ncbi:MAG TPA: protein translocase subunit SecD [Phycicoccus sp.]|nr:protein translocase subunit SecD [Phycicoccus sp.]HQK31470.1 protein translocase subunit SecD [Phycicoccus sp.]HQY96340.1 protein translocase subunit SecD [Phycicoccus sp.]HRA43921.1 protein translocase subunit SecD [Phycicoccus sp.]
MARTSTQTAARRGLLGMLVLTLALVGLMFGAHQWGSGSLTPKLGLDLEGGTQMILEPRLTGTQDVSPEQIDQARDIIVQRVDAGGISGAEVTTQGGRNIVVAIPGTPSDSVLNAIRRSSQMQFRPVLVVASGIPMPEPSVSGSPSVDPSASPSGSPSAEASVDPASPAPSASPSSTSQSGLPSAFTTDETPSASPSASPSPASDGASPSPSPSATVGSTGSTDPTSLEWITPEIQQQFVALDCSQPNALEGLVDDAAKPLVTCSQDSTAKYVLGPVVVAGSEIADATAGYQALPSGQIGTTVEIALTLKDTGKQQYGEISKKMLALPEPQNQLAATLDSKVLLAPRFNEAILDGRASITGGFTIESARDLAQQLKFGALPMSFDLQTREQISPTLGAEQLRYGLVAGLIGLLLVVVYTLFQYRILGLVTIASIALAALMTYLAITILGWSHNFRLDMAGVTGLIISIGFTADSFIVYFERIRDELRSGRALESAVAQGWARAKRTILAADGVNFLAAGVLYLLASSNVRGFAFTLGLTTLLDLIIVFFFSHPVVALLARRKFFRDGHPWSGLDPRKLDVKERVYAGRGRFAPSAAAQGSAS